MFPLQAVANDVGLAAFGELERATLLTGPNQLNTHGLSSRQIYERQDMTGRGYSIFAVPRTKHVP